MGGGETLGREVGVCQDKGKEMGCLVGWGVWEEEPALASLSEGRGKAWVRKAETTLTWHTSAYLGST